MSSISSILEKRSSARMWVSGKKAESLRVSSRSQKMSDLPRRRWPSRPWVRDGVVLVGQRLASREGLAGAEAAAERGGRGGASSSSSAGVVRAEDGVEFARGPGVRGEGASAWGECRRVGAGEPPSGGRARSSR